MVIVKTYGGLGNQLFQYAAAREIAKIRGDEVAFDLEFQKKDKRRFELKNFGVKEKLVPTIQKRKRVYRFQNFLLKFYRKYIAYSSLDNDVIRYLFGMGGVFFCNYNNPDIPSSFWAHNIVFIAGSFSNEKYFSSIINDLQREVNDFAKEYPLDKKTTTVCVHIRRGDYVGNAIYDICTDNYYYQAMSELEKKVKNCNFLIFSDDIEYIKEKMRFDHSYTIFEEKNTCRTLYCMMQCDHYIMSNSTFSWWAQKFNKNNNKVIIAPERWFNTDEKCDLYNDEWIKMI